MQLDGVLPECAACANNPVEHVGMNRERLSQTLDHLRPRLSHLNDISGPVPPPDRALDPPAFATHLSGVRDLHPSLGTRETFVLGQIHDGTGHISLGVSSVLLKGRGLLCVTSHANLAWTLFICHVLLRTYPAVRQS